eukprot:Rmarinus@m.8581
MGNLSCLPINKDARYSVLDDYGQKAAKQGGSLVQSLRTTRGPQQEKVLQDLFLKSSDPAIISAVIEEGGIASLCDVLQGETSEDARTFAAGILVRCCDGPKCGDAVETLLDLGALRTVVWLVGDAESSEDARAYAAGVVLSVIRNHGLESPKAIQNMPTDQKAQWTSLWRGVPPAVSDLLSQQHEARLRAAQILLEFLRQGGEDGTRVAAGAIDAMASYLQLSLEVSGGGGMAEAYGVLEEVTSVARCLCILCESSTRLRARVVEALREEPGVEALADFVQDVSRREYPQVWDDVKELMELLKSS